MLLGSVELKHLTTFLAIAEECSFGRAAERLGYTQSAVSQQVAALERAVGLPVFLRPGGPRPVELTDAGRVLRTHALAIVGRVREADVELDGLRAGTRGRLRIGSFQSVSVKILPPLLQALSAELPDVDVELTELDDGGRLVDLLERRELDAAFVVSRHPNPGLCERELFDDPFVAVASPGALPAGPVAARDLATLPLIGQHDNDMCQRTIEAGVRAAGVEPHYVFRSGDNAAMQAMARAGRGVALMPRLAVDASDPDITVHELDIPARTVILVWHDTPAAPPAVRRFVELADEVTRPLADP